MSLLWILGLCLRESLSPGLLELDVIDICSASLTWLRWFSGAEPDPGRSSIGPVLRVLLFLFSPRCSRIQVIVDFLVISQVVHRETGPVY